MENGAARTKHRPWETRISGIIFFTDDLENSPVYEGQGKIPDFSAIVNLFMREAMGLKQGMVKNGYCYLDVYMSNIYDTGRLNRKDDMFRMVVCKSVKKGANLGFSIKKVQCAGLRWEFLTPQGSVFVHTAAIPIIWGGRTTGWYCRLKLRNISRSYALFRRYWEIYSVCVNYIMTFLHLSSGSRKPDMPDIVFS